MEGIFVKRVLLELFKRKGLVSSEPLYQGLTSEIMRYLTIHTVVTEENMWELYKIVGPDWHKLCKFCELLNEGWDFEALREMIIKKEV